MELSGLISDVVLGADISVEVLGNELSVAVCKAELSTAVFGTVPSVVVLAAELFIVVEATCTCYSGQSWICYHAYIWYCGFARTDCYLIVCDILYGGYRCSSIT